MRHARRSRRGTAALELAAVGPLLLLLSLGTSDAVGQLRAKLRVDSTATQLGQLVSQCNRIVAPGDTANFWTFAQRSIGNFGTISGSGATGAVIVSAIGRVSNTNRVMWQQRVGSTSHTSSVGTANATATLPSGVSVPDSQTLFVTEVFLRRESWPLAGKLLGGSSEQTLQGSTYFLTRAPDAPSLQIAPGASLLPSCTAA